MTAVTAVPAQPDAVRRVDAIAERYVEERAALDPYRATFAGIPGHDDAVSDLSPEGFAAVREVVVRARAEAERTEPVDVREAAARAAFLERLDLEGQLLASGASADLNVTIDSPLQAVRLVFDLMGTSTEREVAAVVTRLARTPEALAGYRRTLDGQAARLPPARRQVLACARQVDGWTGLDGFFAGLAARLSAADAVGSAPALAADLQRAAGDASAAAAETARWLREDLAPRARARDAVGGSGTSSRRGVSSARRWTSRRRTPGGSRRSPASRRRWPRSQAGLPAARRSTMLSPRSTPTLDRRVQGAEAYRNWMQALADRAVDGLASTHFDVPEPLRTLACRIAPTHEGVIYYTAPGEDFSRPGTMWWAVPRGLESFSTWRETSVVFHEGVPGHHLQIGTTVARKDLLNRWQRTMCWVSGHGEGWALYAERLMGELGWLDDPGDRLGMLDEQLQRAARVVVDIGMHLELTVPATSSWRPGERWTPQLGWEYLRSHSRVGDEALRFELDRYLGWPGQAPSYKVGERIWLAARDEARSRAGAAFDLAAWHRAALDLGSMGLDPLREALTRV